MPGLTVAGTSANPHGGKKLKWIEGVRKSWLGLHVFKILFYRELSLHLVAYTEMGLPSKQYTIEKMV